MQAQAVLTALAVTWPLAGCPNSTAPPSQLSIADANARAIEVRLAGVTVGEAKTRAIARCKEDGMRPDRIEDGYAACSRPVRDKFRTYVESRLGDGGAATATRHVAFKFTPEAGSTVVSARQWVQVRLHSGKVRRMDLTGDNNVEALRKTLRDLSPPT